MLGLLLGSGGGVSQPEGGLEDSQRWSSTWGLQVNACERSVNMKVKTLSFCRDMKGKRDVEGTEQEVSEHPLCPPVLSSVLQVAELSVGRSGPCREWRFETAAVRNREQRPTRK